MMYQFRSSSNDPVSELVGSEHQLSRTNLKNYLREISSISSQQAQQL